MTEKKPKITVVTVCYNAVKEIERTMLSVLNQTYPNIEYIIIDGASTDGTVDMINTYTDRLACFVSEPDKGIFDAMNKGIDYATGEWINFMNAGDVFLNSKSVEDLFDCDTSSYSVVYGDVYGGKVCYRNYYTETPFYKKKDTEEWESVIKQYSQKHY